MTPFTVSINELLKAEPDFLLVTFRLPGTVDEIMKFSCKRRRHYFAREQLDQNICKIEKDQLQFSVSGQLVWEIYLHQLKSY